jgi:hypothetical protein
MKLPRRKFLHLAAVAVSLPTASRYVRNVFWKCQPVVVKPNPIVNPSNKVVTKQ